MLLRNVNSEPRLTNGKTAESPIYVLIPLAVVYLDDNTQDPGTEQRGVCAHSRLL